MGNCMNKAAAPVDHNVAYQSKVGSKSNLSSNPFTAQSGSSRSSLTQPSYKERSEVPLPRTEGEILASPNLKAFSLGDLRAATRNFRPESLLGEGGFGYVFKGWIDEQTLAPSKPGCGMVVAIKKLKPEGFQGHKEWLTEVDYLGQLQHQNLVKLIGYCSDGDNRLLVYELMPKGSLENHLFKRGADPLPWGVRLKVAIGAARGLSFLHNDENQIIYRDFKASNILLDSDFNAKLSDFGLAKAGPTGDRTHVSTQVMGTRGYAAPEYIATGRLSVKADIYSFGVVLLELLTGRRALDKSKPALEQNLVDWAKPYLSDKRRLYRVMDPKLGGQYPKKGAHAVAGLALQCIRNEAKLRPAMPEVLEKLEQLQDAKYDATVPPAPPQAGPRRTTSSSSPGSGSVPRSPMRAQPSPRRPSGSASPLARGGCAAT